MDLNLSGKTVLITGASAGIGKGTAAGFHAEGCTVHMVSRSRERLQAAAESFAGKGLERVHLHEFDMSDSASVPKLAQAAGTPDILVNNAGAIPAGDLLAVDEARWREAWDLKVFGYINLCRAMFGPMAERGHGVIINVTGLAADRFDAGYVAGTAGNAALNAFSKAVGGRGPNAGVRVLAVSPGAVQTDRLVGLMRSRAEAEFGDADRWQGYFGNMPGGRAVSVEEVANIVVFLASDRASAMSGSVVTVDNGHGGNMASFA